MLSASEFERHAEDKMHPLFLNPRQAGFAISLRYLTAVDQVPFLTVAAKVAKALLSGTVMPLLILSPAGPNLFGPNGQLQLKDVIQGVTPDCWLEATLAAIVWVNPNIITNMLHDNRDGSVSVTLYDENGIDATGG
jgi:hypothetical protein